MNDMAEQLDIDFGTDELNDPQYEAKVQDDGSLTDATDAGDTQSPADGGTQDGAEATPADSQQQTEPQEQAAAQQGQTPEQQQSQAGKDGAQQQDEQRGDPRTGIKVDDKGNLVDAAGKIVAKNGFERRQFERGAALTRENQSLQQQLREARDNNAMANALNAVPNKLGLDMRETELGLQAIASFKKDPVATCKWMLQETMRLGYNLNQIVGETPDGQLNGGALDLNAVKAMIADQMQPLIADRTAQQQTVQQNEAAQREYDTFIARHEYANVHEDAIANMLKQNSSTTPEVAYWQLREFAAKNNLDFTKPLREQLAAREGAQQQQAQGNAAPQSQTQQPMPNGGAQVQDMQQQPEMYNADEQWDTIVQQSLRDAGFQH